MKSYQYQIIRYVHDYVTGEFVNIGLVCFDPESSFLKCRVLNKYSRISNFFLEVKGQYLLSFLRQFESRLNSVAEELRRGSASYEALDFITSSILPKDDSAIVCSDLKKGIDTDIDKAFEDLFSRLVEKYVEEPETVSHNDNYAWKKYYKQYFEKHGITRQLKKHSVNTHSDVIDFDRAWKNGVWNCYQSLSLDLSRVESIKNKVYRWSGILRELETTDEHMHLYFLTVSPKKDHGLKNFIEEALASKNQKIKVTLVVEKDAEKFAEKVKREMEEHLP